MAELWLKTLLYNLPIFCGAGVSHYVPAKVKWETAVLDDGQENVYISDIDLIEEKGGIC